MCYVSKAQNAFFSHKFVFCFLLTLSKSDFLPHTHFSDLDSTQSACQQTLQAQVDRIKHKLVGNHSISIAPQHFLPTLEILCSQGQYSKQFYCLEIHTSSLSSLHCPKSQLFLLLLSILRRIQPQIHLPAISLLQLSIPLHSLQPSTRSQQCPTACNPCFASVH